MLSMVIPKATPSQRPTQVSEKTIWLDASAAPLIRVRVSQTVSEQDFREYLRASDAVVQAGRPYALMYDARQTTGLSPILRRQQAEWIDQNRFALRRLCLGAAFVLASAPMRGVLTAIFWIAPLPFDHTIVGALGEAERWIGERLRRVH